MAEPCPCRLPKRRGIQCGAINCRRHPASDSLLPAYGPGPFSPATLYSKLRLDHCIADIKPVITHLFTIRDLYDALGIRVGMGKSRYADVLSQFIAHFDQTPINDTDIFTLEPIADLDPAKVFTYKDGHGRVYAFDAAQLDYSVRELGPTNPYTREEIPEWDLARLRAMIQNGEVPRKSTPDPVNLWHSPADAYTYVLHYYELHGFRCNVEWFIAMNYMDIISIFWYYHTSIKTTSPFLDLDMALGADGDLNSLHFVFAREMLTMINAREHPMQMFHLCNLIIAISQVSPPMRYTIPQWVYNAAGVRI